MGACYRSYSKRRRKMTTPKNTKVELEVHISESGGYWALRVESHNPKSAVRIFKNYRFRWSKVHRWK